MSTHLVRGATLLLIALLVAPIPGALAANNPPVVNANVPAYTQPGVPVSINDRSYDTDGTVVSREWDLDGDGTFETTVAGGIFTHTFPTQATIELKQRATDDLGASSTRSWTIVVDGTKPVSTVTIPAASASGWHKTSSVNVKISRADTGGSGIAVTFVTLDGVTNGRGPGQDLTVPVSGEGVHHLVVASSDRAGNREADQAFDIKIDTTAPVVKLVKPGPAGAAPGPALTGGAVVSGDKVDLEASATDSASGIAGVSFFVGSELIATDTDGSDGWKAVWDTAGRNTGSYQVSAVGVNGAGMTTISGANLLVVLPPPPAVASAGAGVSAENDGDTPAYVVDSGSDGVRIDANSGAPSAGVTDGADQYALMRTAAAAVGFASDGFTGGDAAASGDASAMGEGCDVVVSAANGPSGNCSVDGHVEASGYAFNDGDTPAYVAERGEDAVRIDLGQGIVRLSDEPNQWEIARGVAAYVGLLSDGGQGGGAAIFVDAFVEGRGCHVQTYGGPVEYWYVPSGSCLLV